MKKLILGFLIGLVIGALRPEEIRPVIYSYVRWCSGIVQQLTSNGGPHQ
jgi:hypothetical protein